jgi:O-antigen biosynthesis protein
MILSVVIVSYNVQSFLKQCLNSIYQSDNIDNFEIIVVDNYSFDNTVKMIKTEYPNVKLVENDKNLGFAKAVNIGVKLSTAKNICLINPDSLIKKDTLDVMLNYLQNNDDVGVVGCKVLDSDGKLQLASRRNFPKPLVALPKLLGLSRLFPKSKLFGQYNQTFVDDSITQEVDAVSGSCMMFPLFIYDKIGGFDERYFMYFEDTDFCFETKNAGYKVVYHPETQIIHYKGESLKHAPFNTIDVFYSAMDKFFKKHSSEFPMWFLMKILLKSAILFRKIGLGIQKYIQSVASVIIDIFLFILSFSFAFIVWFPIKYDADVSFEFVLRHWPMFITYLLYWFLSAGLLKLYRQNYLSYGRSLGVSFLAFLLAAASTYLISVFAYSRAVITLSGFFMAILSTGWRIIVHLMYRFQWMKIFQLTPLFTRYALILGSDNESKRIGDLLVNSPNTDFKLIGFVDDVLNNNNDLNIKFLGRTEDLRGIVESHRINEIIIPEKKYPIDRVIHLIQEMIGYNVTFKFIPDGDHHLIGKGFVENLGGVALVDFELPLFDRIHLVYKRIFDIAVSILAIVLTLPFHVYFYLGTRPFKRNIWGKDESTFNVFEYDTKFQWLRMLPYQFSVLTGKMSFVGSEMVDSSKLNPEILFKPGLTGLSQIRSNGVSKSTHRSFEYYYIQNHSLIFDLEILLKSILRI